MSQTPSAASTRGATPQRIHQLEAESQNQQMLNVQLQQQLKALQQWQANANNAPAPNNPARLSDNWTRTKLNDSNFNTWEVQLTTFLEPRGVDHYGRLE